VSDARHHNIEVARRLWRAASEGDPKPLLEMAPDVIWRTYGTGPYAGEFIGIDAVLDYLTVSGQGADDMRAELLDIFASEQGAVILHRSEFRRGPKTLDAMYFLWLRIEDGVVREVASIPWEQARSAAFWQSH
jgi:ketosteroid isomerase-like protein